MEERGVALYALDRFEDAINAFSGLVFQTIRSRLYRAAALIALGRKNDAGKLVREAMAGNAALSMGSFFAGGALSGSSAAANSNPEVD